MSDGDHFDPACPPIADPSTPCLQCLNLCWLWGKKEGDMSGSERKHISNSKSLAEVLPNPGHEPLTAYTRKVLVHKQ